jgi:hypothetical protein
LHDIDKVIVDGNAAGKGLQLSHWPDNTTLPHLKADLSVEIGLRFNALPNHAELLGEREIVTNDHYDTDGLLSAWTVLNPRLAAAHAPALIAAAEAGDFYEFTNPNAVKLHLTIEAFTDPERSPLRKRFLGESATEVEQMAADELLPQFPDLLYDVGEYDYLWGEEFEALTRRLRLRDEGRISVREWPEEQLSVVRSVDRLDHFARNFFARGHRILEATPQEGGTRYVLHYREFLWYDIVSRRTSKKHLLTPVADRLNHMEPPSSGGSWVVTRWTPALYFSVEGARTTRVASHKERRGVSALDLDAVESVIREGLDLLDNAR